MRSLAPLASYLAEIPAPPIADDIEWELANPLWVLDTATGSIALVEPLPRWINPGRQIDKAAAAYKAYYHKS